jgi:hypothetical protein
MAQNLQIDPTKKGDYVVQNGSPIPSDRVEEACWYPLKIPQGKWLYAQTGQGSLLDELENVKRDSSIEQQFAAYAQDAIKRQVIAPGKATASQVTNIAATRTGSSNQIDVVPSMTQISSQLNFVPV